MGDIIGIEFAANKQIEVGLLRRQTPRSKSVSGLISPAVNPIESDAVAEHDADPIKDMRDIMRLSDWYIQNGKYRDNMLFITGINFGLRVSDLRRLRFGDLIDSNMMFKETFEVFEIKTRNTRVQKRNRHVTINNAVIEAVTLYLEHTPGITLDTYMFRSESNNGSGNNVPIHNNSVDEILKKGARAVGITSKVSTHTLRKTFGYHQMVMSNNDPRKLMLLSKMFGHASVSVTMDYIGFTNEEICEAYKGLNLGSREYNYLDSRIEETENVSVRVG